MHYLATADTDIGIHRETNQDSALIKHAVLDSTEVLLVVICDGMGGLANGELASATVIRDFYNWFDNELPLELEKTDMELIGGKWANRLRELNVKIREFAASRNCSMGTTFTGMLIVGDEYIAAHVGDTRLYLIDSQVEQLTEDQTFVAREVRRGAMTPEQARIDKRRNMLLQCIGASDHVSPQIITGKVKKNSTYLICSDGFRHEIDEQELLERFEPKTLTDKRAMHRAAHAAIETVKGRLEKDNITVILIKTE